MTESVDEMRRRLEEVMERAHAGNPGLAPFEDVDGGDDDLVLLDD